jgi:hypothetical protein
LFSTYVVQDPTSVNIYLSPFLEKVGAQPTGNGLNALLFNLQTSNKGVPTDPRAGSFSSNVMTDNIHGGKFMFSNSIFADGWINGSLINGVILPNLGDRPTGATFKKMTPTSWEFADESNTSVVHDHKGNTGQKIDQDMKQVRSISVKLLSSNNQIQVCISPLRYFQRF